MSEEHQHTLPVGYQLQEYQLQAILGIGGFGITYLALDSHLKCQVAIKEYMPNELAIREQNSTIRAKSHDDEGAYEWGLSRFMDEAATLSRFKHPNIVRVSRLFKAHNTAYMVMDYEEGDSLANLLAKPRFAKGLPQAELKNVLYPLLEGLATVHAEKILHRDIKPGNIYIRRRDSSPVLLDFGAARDAVGRKSRSVTSIVTPGYSPYEQYSSDSSSQGPWTDLYAMAAVVYKMISGQAPIDATERAQAQMKRKPDPLRSAQQVGKGRYDENLLQATDQALAVLEEERPQTVEQWQLILRSKPNPRPIPVDREEEPPRPPAWLWGSVAAGVVGLLVMGGWLWQGHPTQSSAIEYIEPATNATAEVAESANGTMPQWRPQKKAEESTKKERKADQQAFARAQNNPSVAAYEGYLQRCSRCDHQGEALAAIKALKEAEAVQKEKKRIDKQAFENARNRHSVAAYEGYLRECHRCDYQAEALAAIKDLSQTTLTVQATPPEAKVRILHIKPRYQAGMVLKPGNYEIEVSAPGYPTKREWVDIAGKTKWQVVLKKGHQAGEIWPEPVTGMKFVWIPQGSFKMGSDSGSSDEKPVHGVELDGYWLGQTEVTNAQYRQYKSSHDSKDYKGNSLNGNAQPVVNVSWEDAKGYATWLSGRSAYTFSLPTEAQWEYACRSGGKAEKYSGSNDVGRVAWHWENSGKHSHQVGTKQVNGAGLYDMSGNVWEWVEDWYDGNAYSEHKSKNPVRLKTGSGRVSRGGSWDVYAGFARCANRGDLSPGFRLNYLGFRLARTP